MKKISLIILLAVLAVVIFVLGAGLGIYYQSRSIANKCSIAANLPSITTKALSSRVIPVIMAYGTVTKIEGRDITLYYAGNSLTIPIDQNAKIIFAPASLTGPVSSVDQIEADFSDIKIGQTLNINIKILADGKMQGPAVTILAPVSAPANRTGK